MTRLSCIIPNRNSPFTTATISDLLAKAHGDVQVIVHVDEKFPEPRVTDSRVTYLTHEGPPVGMRAGINRAASAATGEYLMKTDDHCLFAPGFDLALIRAHAEDNWVQIPRRYSLDAEKWAINPDRPYRDYSYLCYPYIDKPHDSGIHGTEWYERQRQRSDPKYDIDETMSMQGSSYFMTKNHFDNTLGGLSEVGYGQFAQEAQEIGMKTWLGGGKLMTNKRTHYGHLHKGRKYGRMYRFDDTENKRGINWSAWYWMTNQWAERKHDMRWFIERFWPVPTWPLDALENWDRYIAERFSLLRI